jgi:hypothetical protein
MKILLVNDYGTLTGGAEIQMVLLRDELRKRGHDARLFASSARPRGKVTLITNASTRPRAFARCSKRQILGLTGDFAECWLNFSPM